MIPREFWILSFRYLWQSAAAWVLVFAHDGGCRPRSRPKTRQCRPALAPLISAMTEPLKRE